MTAHPGRDCSSAELAVARADRHRVLAAARATGLADFLLSTEYGPAGPVTDARRLMRLGEVVDRLRLALGLPDPSDLIRAHPASPASPARGGEGGER